MWPEQSIDFVLRAGGVSLADVDCVAHGRSAGFQADKHLLLHVDRVIDEAQHRPEGLAQLRAPVAKELPRDKTWRDEFDVWAERNGLRSRVVHRPPRVARPRRLPALTVRRRPGRDVRRTWRLPVAHRYPRQPARRGRPAAGDRPGQPRRTSPPATSASHAASPPISSSTSTEKFAKTCPAVVHDDNTARPQIVRQQDDPFPHRLLMEWHARSGQAALVNTSYNKHEEPIVGSPRDALAPLRDGVVDLVPGDDVFLVWRTRDVSFMDSRKA
ncbi:carbamoyltransferase C-terminal domain-containing protein [Streptomyces sp. NPDC006458]|uniref:carbamoyltransferase C-terminal domain-containing protein n=1 Tax=Streptomyces sp. NPDC006458 TaxID=3154302 RepID=UPI0033B4FEFC